MLPDPPLVEVEPLESAVGARPFLSVERTNCLVRHPGEKPGRPFTYDTVWRGALDAAVVIAHFRRDGVPWLYLRSCVRPPLAFREQREQAFVNRWGANLWELPAGLIEEEGEFEQAARNCAARELFEEVGFRVLPSEFELLGPWVYPAPGMVAERQVFLAVQVEPSFRLAPAEDSALEQGGMVLPVSLDTALDACRAGWVPDSKTELGLRRFAEQIAR